eukprot:5637539-Ditylum_brightwellii.AAC.1
MERYDMQVPPYQNPMHIISTALVFPLFRFNRTLSMRYIGRSNGDAAIPTNRRELSSAARMRDRRAGKNDALVLQ